MTTKLSACAVAPLISMEKGEAESSNFTLLAMPAQPLAPLNAVDCKVCPFWMTSIQAGAASVTR